MDEEGEIKEGFPITKYNAIIRYYYKTDPEKLPLDEWVKLVSEWRYIREIQSMDLKNNLSEVLNELAKAIFGKQ